eukprot:Trichotokara_eunicae@DN669_c0_g1_i1.p2
MEHDVPKQNSKQKVSGRYRNPFVKPEAENSRMAMASKITKNETEQNGTQTVSRIPSFGKNVQTKNIRRSSEGQNTTQVIPKRGSFTGAKTEKNMTNIPKFSKVPSFTRATNGENVTELPSRSPSKIPSLSTKSTLKEPGWSNIEKRNKNIKNVKNMELKETPTNRSPSKSAIPSGIPKPNMKSQDVKN